MMTFAPSPSGAPTSTINQWSTFWSSWPYNGAAATPPYTRYSLALLHTSNTYKNHDAAAVVIRAERFDSVQLLVRVMLVGV